MSRTIDRLEPAQVPQEQLEALREALLAVERPCLVGREDFRLALPDPIFHVLLHIVQGMRKGQTMLLMPEDETFTTQAAADFLGVSRPFLVKLLEAGTIPFFNAGSHRKIWLSDLHAFELKRGEERKAFLEKLSKEAHEAGLYENELEA